MNPSVSLWSRTSIVGIFLFFGCANSAPSAPLRSPSHYNATQQIITPTENTTESDLARRAESALVGQRWREAADAYATLVAAEPNGPHIVSYLFGLVMAHEGLEEREKARDRYREIARRFPQDRNARPALARAATLHAYLEEWKELGEIGDALLLRTDIDDVDRIVALGARGLSRVELGDDLGASKDILEGLELSDRTHYAAGNVLPLAVAALRFALGEVRRIRSERYVFVPLPNDFLQRIELRSSGLLDAQKSYADAVRASDPHWAAMASYRVGEMYRALHRDLMTIPAPVQAKTERDRQLFLAFMHVRYRVLLEKGIRQMDETISMAERTGENSSWIKRSKSAKKEMDLALEEEKATLKTYPFTEAEIRAALDVMAKKVEKP